MTHSLIPSLLTIAIAAGCASHQDVSEVDVDSIVANSLEEFVEAKPGLYSEIDQAYGYAVFPEVGKGGFIVGTSAGSGYVYEQGTLIGTATVRSLTVGATVGGQAFRQLMLFDDKAALEEFKEAGFEFSATTDAAIADRGASAHNRPSEGVAVHTITQGGAMAEASIGTQRFTYRRVSAQEASMTR